eukprot:scaffold48005_cov31-Tisochrysis_lutea.AAC.1
MAAHPCRALSHHSTDRTVICSLTQVVALGAPALAAAAGPRVQAGADASFLPAMGERMGATAQSAPDGPALIAAAQHGLEALPAFAPLLSLVDDDVTNKSVVNFERHSQSFGASLAFLLSSAAPKGLAAPDDNTTQARCCP